MKNSDAEFQKHIAKTLRKSRWYKFGFNLVLIAITSIPFWLTVFLFRKSYSVLGTSLLFGFAGVLFLPAIIHLVIILGAYMIYKNPEEKFEQMNSLFDNDDLSNPKRFLAGWIIAIIFYIYVL